MGWCLHTGYCLYTRMDEGVEKKRKEKVLNASLHFKQIGAKHVHMKAGICKYK